ncbi:MAG: sulfurtransferase TusA family protein [Inquilinus sp.]|nr:sulfurtransferase TusA family protein [Inquilinus sp.]
MAASNKADYFLDISEELCPFTFVRTKLLLEKMRPGEIVEVMLRAGEPLENVPRAAVEQGHEVLDLEPAEDGDLHRLRIRRR